MKNFRLLSNQLLALGISFSLLFGSVAPLYAAAKQKSNAEVKVLSEVLKQKDLSARERQFIDLQRQLLSTRDLSLKVQQEELETIQALEDFYMLAYSVEDIWRVVWAMHHSKHNLVNLQKQGKDPFKNQADQVTTTASTGKNSPLLREFTMEQLVDGWSRAHISLETLVEYMDPMDPSAARDYTRIAAAASLLFGTVLAYNVQPKMLSAEEKQHGSWFLFRAMERARYSYAQLEKAPKGKDVLPAQIYLFLFMAQATKFLNEYGDSLVPSPQNLRKARRSKIASQLAQAPKYPGSIVATAIVNKISEGKFSMLEIPSVITFNMMTQRSLQAIGSFVNVGGKDFKKGSEKASMFFGTIYNNLRTLPIEPTYISDEIYNLLLDAVQIKNSVAYRLEALELASMLGQIGATGQVMLSNGRREKENFGFLKPSFFSKFATPNFRKNMAGYTAGIYGPTVAWNVGKDAQGFAAIERYGLDAKELDEFSSRVAFLFETFLPVEEPVFPTQNITSGEFAGCNQVRNYAAKPKEEVLSGLPRGALMGYSKSNKPCAQADARGWADKAVVRAYTQQKGDTVSVKLIGMQTYHAQSTWIHGKDLVNTFLGEVASFYLSILAMEALVASVKVAWRFIQAVSIATKTAAKVKPGLRLARFQGKFSQIWKYTGKDWYRSVGITDVVIEENTTKIMLGDGKTLSKVIDASAGSLKWRMEVRKIVHQATHVQKLLGAGGKSLPGSARISQAILADTEHMIFGRPGTYVKSARIQARQAKGGEVIQTVMANGHVETNNVAKAGDWIVTNPGGERYIVPQEKFAQKYEAATELGKGWYKPTGGTQQFVQINRDMDIVAPWGEKQSLKKGAFLNVTNPKDIYGVAEKEFYDTYKLLTAK